jgi:hypothetical protein
MRASFEPTALQVAVLFGWTVFNAVRERLSKFRGPAREAPAQPAADATPRVNVAPPSWRQREYSLN